MKFEKDDDGKIKQIPETLYECFIVLDDMNIGDVDAWLKDNEDDALARSHHGVGVWIRNHWGLWHGGKLKEWFESVEVKHPDDMSGIILTAYHRIKNNKELKIEELIDYYVEYYLDDREKLLRKRKKKLTIINYVL